MLELNEYCIILYCTLLLLIKVFLRNDKSVIQSGKKWYFTFVNIFVNY